MITDRGDDAEYRRLCADGQDLISRLSMDDGVEFEPAPLAIELQVSELRFSR
ncbi:hypothetical protein [Nocardia sp. NPDC057227]|uniref:hypothetical protein n=1 Tax=Nocardia sp. NPDC057227 TaxID=3346056 RepID=UPI00363E0D21